MTKIQRSDTEKNMLIEEGRGLELLRLSGKIVETQRVKNR